MNNLIIRFLLTVILLSTFLVEIKSQNIDSLANEVLALYESGEYEKIKELAEELEQMQLGGIKYADILEIRGLIASDHEKDYELALAYHNRALELRLTNAKSAEKELPDSYSNIADVYRRQGEYNKSIDFYSKSLSLSRTVFGENSQQVLDNYYFIGWVQEWLGAIDLSLNYLNKSLEIAQVINPESVAEADIRNYIGLVYLRQGKYNRARDYFAEAIHINKELGYSISPDAAIIYNNIAITYRSEKDYERAKEYYERALAIHKELYQGTNLDQALIYNNIGTLLSKQGKQKEALESYEIALNIRKDILGSNHPLIAITIFSMASCHLLEKNYIEALHYYQKSIIANTKDFDSPDIYINPSLNSYFHGTSLLQSLSYKAKSFEGLYTKTENGKDLLLALNTYLLSDSLIDKMKYAYISETAKLSLAENSLEIYKNCIENAIDMSGITEKEKYINIAFHISEKSKSSILNNSILKNKKVNIAGIPDSLIQYKKYLLKSITDKKSSLIRSQTSKQEDIKVTKGFQNELHTLNIEYDALVKNIQNHYPNYYQLKYSTQTASIEDVQTHILKEDQVLVEYFLGRGSLHIFAITKTGYEAKKVKIDSSFHAYFAQLRNSLIASELAERPADGFDQYISSAYYMYEKLLAPIEDLIKGKELIIIPDDKLALIPFGTLLTKEPLNGKNDYKTLPYLLRSYNISYANSATTLLNNTKDVDSFQKDIEILAFAPSYESKLEIFTESDTVRNSLGPLGWTEQEVNNLNSYFGSDNYLGEQATEKAFKSRMENYNIIHIASHSLVDDENPMYSKIAFTLDEKDSLNDGYLHTFELYNTHLNAEMAVLSACNTGYGKIQKGEGIMSLGYAFAYAGVPSIVMSHWQVNDRSTYLLMDNFYKYLAEGMDKSVALRKAKLDLLNNEEVAYANPYYWGAFVAYGDDSPIQAKRIVWKWYVISLLIALFLSFLYFRKVRKA